MEHDCGSNKTDQSATCTKRSPEVVPCSAKGKKPPLMKAVARVPPVDNIPNSIKFMERVNAYEVRSIQKAFENGSPAAS